MTLAVYLTLALVAALSCAWALRRVLRADALRWERSETVRRLHELVSGKLLVRNGLTGGYDVHDGHGAIPEDTVLVSDLPLYPSYGLSLETLSFDVATPASWGFSLAMNYAYAFPVVNRPGDVFKITGV